MAYFQDVSWSKKGIYGNPFFWNFLNFDVKKKEISYSGESK